MKSDKASQDIHSISQVSRLLFTLEAPMKTITTQTWQNSKIDNNLQTHAHEDQKVFKGCNEAKDKVGKKYGISS